MERNPLRCCEIVLLDEAPQRREVGNRLRRPDRGHDLLGAGFSFVLPQEATQSLTWSCGIPSPRSSEAMARLIPATCHSLISRYSLMASAARKERLRPVFLANRSSLFFTAVSTRTVKVVDFIRHPVCVVVYNIVPIPEMHNRINRPCALVPVSDPLPF